MPDRPKNTAIPVRPLLPSEWELLQSLRVRAVSESPDAFEPLDPLLAESSEYWRDIAQSLASPDGDILVAFDGSVAKGMSFVRIDEHRIGHIGAMWVDPGMRRTGVGKRLLRRAIEWHLSGSVSDIRLWVTDGNDPAISLYRAAGFTFTGEDGLLRKDDELRVLEMRIWVTPSEND